jgi:membrane fusion protein, multidrug efflux system
VRYVVTLVAVFVLLGGLGAVKAAQIGMLVSNGKAAEQQGPPPETVATAIAKAEVWEGTLTDVGSVASAKGVTLSNEAPGKVTRIRFESGQNVKRGHVVVELDANAERAQLAAAVARKQLATSTMQRTQALARTGSIAPAQVDADRAQLESAEKDAEALRAQIAHKEVRAPFDGRLGIRAVNLGQYLNAGTPIASLETVRSLYVDFTTPQERLGDIAIGMPVRITLATDGGAPHVGAIQAIEPAVDPTTRAVKVRADVPNDDETLRTGMFVKVAVVLPQPERVVIVPATAILHASFGDSVFVVEDKPADAPGMRTTPDGKPVKVARQQFIRAAEARGDFVAIQSGLPAGQEVVAAGTFKLRNNTPIVVNNAVQAKPDLDPHPQNR